MKKRDNGNDCDGVEWADGIELNEQFLEALDLMEKSRRHVLITGRAGTGKSTLLEYFRDHTEKRSVFLAPTGVAAVNIHGQTIHSFFGFKPDVTPSSVKKIRNGKRTKLYQKLQTIVIDEVSMVRADLLDCVDRFLQIHGPEPGLPFGGVQMIFIGDLYQLPPVVTSREKDLFRAHYKSPYFFSARALEGMDMAFVELEKIYRQSETEFISILNAIRNRSVTDEELALLNERCDPDFVTPEEGFYIHMTSTNAQADRINEEHLKRLKGKTWISQGIVEGEFGREYLPTSPELKLKKKAQIMLLNNDAYGRWINGTIGRIKGFATDEEGEDVIRATLDNGMHVDIEPHRWDIFRFFLKDGELASESVGSFTQYPLRLAFAVTIHKSQGKTFSRAVIDVGRGTFAHGQMYVALSRCTSLEGIVLKQPVRKGHILMDWEVVRFLTGFQYAQAERELPREEKVRRIKEAIRDGSAMSIVYLKAKDEKSRRTVKPLCVEERTFKGHPFLALEAFCLTRRATRVFNVDRILAMEDEFKNKD